jgi:polar amino acid transport system substrate-binding protein
VDATWWLGSGIYGAKSNSENASVGTHLGEIAEKERDSLGLKIDNDMAFFLVQLQANIQGQLNDLDLAVSNSSHQLSAVGIGGEKTRSILRNLISSNPHFAEATTGSPEGKIVIAEPDVYKNSEGTDISKNDVTSQLMDTKSPVFSQVFHLVEGYNASVISYPVFSPSGEFIGGVGAIIKPAELLGSIIAPQLKGTNYSVTVMQKDGLALYDPDPSQIGKMLFDDPMFKPYPQLLTLGKNMVAERSGMGSYVFLTKQHDRNVTKEVYWTTVGLHGTEWRLAATRIAG